MVGRTWQLVLALAFCCCGGGVAPEVGDTCQELGERVCGGGDVLECKRASGSAAYEPRVRRERAADTHRYVLRDSCGTDERCSDGACVHDPDDDDDDF